MKVLHLLVSGGTGGIEILMRNYSMHSQHDNIYVFVWGAGEIAEEMEKSGKKTVVLDAKNDGTLTTLKKIKKICETEQADVVVSHHSAPLLKLALVYIKLALENVRAIAFAHADAKDICGVNRKKGLWLRKRVHSLGFRKADGIIAISESVKKSLSNYLKINEGKIEVIYNGTPVEAISGERKRSDVLKLIYVGRLIEEKGVQNTIAALAEISDEIPFELTVAGDGEYRKELEKLAQNVGIADRVHFLGTRKDIPQLLADSDIFIHMPNWEEGFGITVIEAMVHGLVCICNDKGAMTEIIDDGINGYIINAKKSEMLGKKLRELQGCEENEWARVRANATEKAKEFSIEKYSVRLDGYLKNNCDN